MTQCEHYVWGKSTCSFCIKGTCCINRSYPQRCEGERDGAELSNAWDIRGSFWRNFVCFGVLHHLVTPGTPELTWTRVERAPAGLTGLLGKSDGLKAPFSPNKHFVVLWTNRARVALTNRLPAVYYIRDNKHSWCERTPTGNRQPAGSGSCWETFVETLFVWERLVIQMTVRRL